MHRTFTDILLDVLLVLNKTNYWSNLRVCTKTNCFKIKLTIEAWFLERFLRNPERLGLSFNKHGNPGRVGLNLVINTTRGIRNSQSGHVESGTDIGIRGKSGESDVSHVSITLVIPHWVNAESLNTPGIRNFLYVYYVLDSPSNSLDSQELPVLCIWLDPGFHSEH